jgi:phosphoribosylaminoimidazole-succinocarboxamide synthase
VEYAFANKKSNGDRGLLLVDSIGPDELRLTYENLPLSKEFLRQIYNGSTWYEAVGKAKKLASERKTQDWKKICVEELHEVPRKLTSQELEVASLLYQALANEVSRSMGRPLDFDSSATLKSWLKAVGTLS